MRYNKFSPNDHLIASCGDDKSLRVYDVNSGECIRCFTEERGKGRQLTWHSDSHMIAVAMTCNLVKIFDLVAQQLIHLYEVHSGTCLFIEMEVFANL